MSQRAVEHVIGRLITDEDFRRDFLASPHGFLDGLAARGCDLTAAEIGALASTDADAWQRAAEAIDPRLQKASLRGGRAAHTDGDEA